MIYSQLQIDAVIQVTGPEVFIEHVLGVYSEAVGVGMMLSHNGDGLTDEDIKAIEALMPKI